MRQKHKKAGKLETSGNFILKLEGPRQFQFHFRFPPKDRRIFFLISFPETTRELEEKHLLGLSKLTRRELENSISF